MTRRGPNPFVRPRLVATRMIDVIVASSDPTAPRQVATPPRNPLVPNLPLSLPRLVPGGANPKGAGKYCMKSSRARRIGSSGYGSSMR
ncbi:MAG: hypothetical protein R3B96_07215 [Pirellulaceae bacterium]